MWNACHAESKILGKSEGCFASDGTVNGDVLLVHDSILFYTNRMGEKAGARAIRLSELPREELADIGEKYNWNPLYIEGKVKRSRSR